MPTSTDPRRERRRRLALTWSVPASEAGTPTAERRPVAGYGPGADPERQRGPATLLPTTLGRFALAAIGLLAVVTAAVAAGAWEPLTGRLLFPGGGRFAGTLEVLRGCFDPRSGQSLAGWLSHLCLALAAGVALIVRLMRQHRRDDFKGRFRAWGWMAAVLAGTACSGALPLGRLCGVALSEATGIALGPGGLGWWYLIAACAWGIVVPWAVLPLHERSATAAWLTLALAAWATAAGCGWLGQGRDQAVVAGQAAWSLGCGLVAIALLAAARSVIREVRGQCRSASASTVGGRSAAGNACPRSDAPLAIADPDHAPARSAAAVPVVASEPTADEAEPIFIDGSEAASRQLSKAERKRLRKLARMQQAA